MPANRSLAGVLQTRRAIMDFFNILTGYMYALISSKESKLADTSDRFIQATNTGHLLFFPFLLPSFSPLATLLASDRM